MKRVVLLAVLALALPLAASATTVDYAIAGTVGTGVSMVSGSDAPGGMYTITSALIAINGISVTPGKVTVTTGTLMTTASNCAGGCTFTGGTLMVWNSSNTLLFSGTFSGTLTVNSGVDVEIHANAGGSPVISGFDIANNSGSISGDFNVLVPEPGTLGLLGTGLIGLAGAVRRKLLG